MRCWEGLSVGFSAEETYLLAMLEAALNCCPIGKVDKRENVSWNLLLENAKKHAVLSLLYDVLERMEMTKEKFLFVEFCSRQIVSQNYHLLFLTKYLVDLLEQNQIQVLVLKGVATAEWYPVPELRKSGDVDLMIPRGVSLEKVTEILAAEGFQCKQEQHANYHREFISKEGMIAEIHTDFTERFANKQLNIAMERQVQGGFGTMIREKAMGIELPMLNKAYHAYELLLHMLHHFTTSGFGLKLLCDWVVCWKQEWTKEEKEMFQQLTKESKTTGFAEAVTAICVKYLGLESERFAWNYSSADIPMEELLREILDSEEFGGNDNNRMVMMSGTGFWAYIKEFHHQMHLNFPKAGNCFLLWPVLWVITLVRFLENNRKVRNTSTREILKEANRRSALMERLKLLK